MSFTKRRLSKKSIIDWYESGGVDQIVWLLKKSDAFYIDVDDNDFCEKVLEYYYEDNYGKIENLIKQTDIY